MQHLHFSAHQLGQALACWLFVTGSLSSIGVEPAPLMRDFLGINGHTVQFKPGLYRPICRLVRDYHPVEWDLGKETPILPQVAQLPDGRIKATVDESPLYLFFEGTPLP